MTFKLCAHVLKLSPALSIMPLSLLSIRFLSQGGSPIRDYQCKSILSELTSRASAVKRRVPAPAATLTLNLRGPLARANVFPWALRPTDKLRARRIVLILRPNIKRASSRCRVYTQGFCPPYNSRSATSSRTWYDKYLKSTRSRVRRVYYICEQ